MSDRVLLPLVAAALLSAGCRTYTAPDPLLERPIFQRVWYDRGTDWGGFQTIAVHPVRLETMETRAVMPWMFEPASPRDLATVARYAQERIARTTGGTPSDAVGPGTLVLETTLVEVLPDRDQASGRLNYDAEVQLEARLRDGTDGRVVATFLDRRDSRVRHAFQRNDWEVRTRWEIDRWAAGFAGALRFMEDGTLDSSRPFDFGKW
ncbi:MAG: hypothetical protein ACF8XB_24395 [Planctomycetota bacterium JB042]